MTDSQFDLVFFECPRIKSVGFSHSLGPHWGSDASVAYGCPIGIVASDALRGPSLTCLQRQVECVVGEAAKLAGNIEIRQAILNLWRKTSTITDEALPIQGAEVGFAGTQGGTSQIARCRTVEI